MPHSLMAFLKGKKPAGLFRREGRSIGSSFCVFVVVVFFFFFFLKGAFLAWNVAAIPCVLSTRPSKAFVALWQQHSVFFSWYFALHASPTFFFSNTIFEGDVRLAKLPLFPSMSEARSMRFGGEKQYRKK